MPPGSRGGLGGLPGRDRAERRKETSGRGRTGARGGMRLWNWKRHAQTHGAAMLRGRDACRNVCPARRRRGAVPLGAVPLRSAPCRGHAGRRDRLEFFTSASWVCRWEPPRAVRSGEQPRGDACVGSLLWRWVQRSPRCLVGLRGVSPNLSATPIHARHGYRTASGDLRRAVMRRDLLLAN